MVTSRIIGPMAKRSRKSDGPAAALARMRAESLTPERRSEIARVAGKASAKSLTPSQRKERARVAAKASAAARAKKGRSKNADV